VREDVETPVGEALDDHASQILGGHDPIDARSAEPLVGVE